MLTRSSTALAAAIMLTGCDAAPKAAAPASSGAPASATRPAESAPPPAIQAWMDRLTVPHTYDPETGFIVATATTPLPPVLADAPPLDEAIRRAGGERVVVAFATADRCAPCQQFKHDALRDARVIERLSGDGLIATHVEVDRQGGLAETYLGGAAIPMSYALRDGAVVATLRGQRSADELIAWLDTVVAGG
ncbi:MAG: thioredoxin family protein [Planctomycetota bacterium]|jgi:hypothetical protein